ncbi:MAG TPA: hypothetical protein VGT40_15625 [Methylomirabilota bacterium]|jgi:hypothetical protein|nr:hypothetical protein [Methylomirabilota bacterium]
MNKTITRVLVDVSAPLVLGAAAVAAEKTTEPRSPDPAVACAQTMKDPGITEQGRKAMQEFMQSPRAHDAMANMMAMARGMGNGDVMLGMTKMMEMMGSMGGGGTMGGQGGMMQPGKPSGK